MNKKLFVFLLAFFTSISISYASENLAAQFYVKEGKKEFKAKEYDEAIIQFRKALLAQPDNEEALMYLKMLGFGGSAAKKREQDPAVKTSEKSKSSEESTEKSEEVRKDKIKKVKKKDLEPVDDSVEVIEAQINAEEKAALIDLRTQADEDKKTALKKLREGQTTESTDSKSTSKKSKKTKSKSKAKAETKVKPKASEIQKKEDSASTEVSAKVAKDLDIAKTDPLSPVVSAGSQSAQDSLDVPQQGSTEDIIIPSAVAVNTPVESKKSSAVKKTDSKSLDTTLTAQPHEKTPKSSAVKKIKQKALKDKKELEEKIDAQTAQKINEIHKKFESKPIGLNEKTTFRDFDDDGIPEEISLKESRLIEKVEQKAQEQKQNGVTKIMNQAAKDEKAALKKIRAKSAKKNKKIKETQETSMMNAKSGDIIPDDIPSGDEANEVVLSDKEQAVVDEIDAELAKKEEELHTKFAVKKALRISEVEKKTKAKPQAQEEIGSLNQPNTDVAVIEDETETPLPLVKRDIPASMPKSMQAQNTVLKKKFAQVVDMSQKDQVLIKDLETDLKENEEKVGALENNLRETQANLDSKVALLSEKEEKLKDLSERIAKMETDVNSKQYDFKDKQIEYEKKLQAIQEEFGNYKSERANTEDELKEQLKTLKEALAKKIAELNAVQEKLIFTENKLKATEEKNNLTIKQYDDMKKTLSELEGRLSGLQGSDLPLSEDEPQMVTLDTKNLPAPQDKNDVIYQQWIKRHDKLIERLKEKLMWSREQIEFLGRYDIKLNDQKMAALKEQLAEVKKQLNMKSAAANARTEEDFALIEGRLKDSQERLDMVEKILGEKDDQIKELEDQLNKVLSAF